MTLPAPLHDDLWRSACELDACATAETRVCLGCFRKVAPEHLVDDWCCSECHDDLHCQCGSRRQGEAETGGRAA